MAQEVFRTHTTAYLIFGAKTAQDARQFVFRRFGPLFVPKCTGSNLTHLGLSRPDFSGQRSFCENEAVRGPSPRLPGASAWLQNLFEHPGNTDDVEPRVPTRSAGPPGTILGGSTSSLLSGGCKKVHVVWGQRGTGSCLYTTPTSLLALL